MSTDPWQPVRLTADQQQNETNLPFYQKHGFEVMSDGVAPKGNLRMWTMVRKPESHQTNFAPSALHHSDHRNRLKEVES